MYFTAIKESEEYNDRLKSVLVEIVEAKNSTPEAILREAIKLENDAKRRNNPFLEIWLVFDHDYHPHRRKAHNDGLKQHYQIAFSAICFEQWYLLHFKKSAKSYSSAEKLIRDLKKYYPDYAKAKRNDFQYLKKQTQEAIKNAIWLREQSLENKHITHCNPYTDVDKLVLRLMNQ